MLSHSRPGPVLHLLRRAGKAAPPAEILRGGEITLDRNGRLVQVGAQTVNLTPSEFELLAALMSAPGCAFSRLDLLQGAAYKGYERTIDVHIRNLRTKIEADPSQPRYVETVYGHGYRFSSDVYPMRSLALKLTLAFLIVGLTGVVLVAVFAGLETQREFDQFVLNRYQLDLVAD